MKGLLACLLCVSWMQRGHTHPRIAPDSKGVSPGGGGSSGGGIDIREEGAPYDFTYTVKDEEVGYDFSHSETDMEHVAMDPLFEEANYRFQYEVQDPESGNDFGHMEARMGNTVTGSYHVLLPDGRVQRVDYIADQDGYKPMISYEGEAKYGPGVGVGKPMVDVLMETA